MLCASRRNEFLRIKIRDGYALLGESGFYSVHHRGRSADVGFVSGVTELLPFDPLRNESPRILARYFARYTHMVIKRQPGFECLQPLKFHRVVITGDAIVKPEGMLDRRSACGQRVQHRQKRRDARAAGKEERGFLNGPEVKTSKGSR